MQFAIIKTDAVLAEIEASSVAEAVLSREALDALAHGEDVRLCLVRDGLIVARAWRSRAADGSEQRGWTVCPGGCATAA